MAKGRNTQSERILQLVPESAPGTLDPAAPPIILSNLRHDWQEENAFDEHTASGRNHREFTAEIEQVVNVSGEFVPYYNLLDDTLLPFSFGEPVSDDTADGARTRVYKNLLTGRTDRRTFSLEEGIVTLARRAGYGLIPSWSIRSTRGGGGKTRGNISMLARKNADGVAMSLGDFEQDEVQVITLNEVDGARTIETPGGDTFSIALGADETTVQTVARATVDPEFDNVVVEADITANPFVDLTGSGTSSFSGAMSGHHTNLWDNDPSTASWQGVGSWQGYDMGSAVVINAYSIQPQNNVGNDAPASWTLQASNTGLFTGEEVTLDSKSGYTTANWSDAGSYGKRLQFSINNTTAYRYYRLMWGSSTSTDITICEAELGLLTYSGTYTFTFPSSVGNVGVMVSSDDDVTIETTQQGNAGGDNRIKVEPLPILPQHWKCYVADSFDDLDNEDNFIGTVKELAFGEENAVSGTYSHDTTDSYSDHVEGEEVAYSFELLLLTSSTVCTTLLAGSKEYVSAPQHVRFHAVCPDDPYEVTFDFYGSIGETPQLEYIDNVEYRRFKFVVLDHPTADASIIVTTVVADE